MKMNFKRVLCSLIALVMVLSVAFLPTLTANAAETLTEFTHPESPTATETDKALLEELKAVDPSHIYSYGVSEFTLPLAQTWGDAITDDPAAYGGRAALLSAAPRMNDQVNCLLIDKHGLPLIMVDQNKGAFNFAVIPQADLKNDGEYHLYKLANQVPIVLDSYKFMLFFADWALQLHTLPEDLKHMQGKPMDIYVSMKIKGDFTGSDPYNLPTYYFDRVIITEACEAFGVEFTDGEAGTCMANATKVGTCPKCGNTVTKEVEYSMVPHSYTNYVTAEDGSQVAECDFGCGKTDVIEAETEPKETEAPATEPKATEPDETEAPADDDNKGDDAATGSSTGLTPIIWVVIAVIVVLIAGAAFVAVKFLRKKE